MPCDHATPGKGAADRCRESKKAAKKALKGHRNQYRAEKKLKRKKKDSLHYNKGEWGRLRWA